MDLLYFNINKIIAHNFSQKVSRSWFLSFQLKPYSTKLTSDKNMSFPKRLLTSFLTIFIIIVSFQATAMTNAEKSSKLALIKQIKSNGGTVYAIVPKSTKSPFFEVAAKGCEDTAKKMGIHCIYFGSNTENARLQVEDVLKLIEAGIDGISISAIKTSWIEKKIGAEIKKWGKPLISFDSPASRSISQSYIGTNNYQIGRELGKKIRLLKPDGGTFCIQTERPDSPNHANRMKGIVDGLTPNKRYMKIWESSFTCPVTHFGDFEVAAIQLDRMINKFKVDVFISTGGGSQFRPKIYRELMLPHKSNIESGKLVIGNIDTTPAQLEYLEEGISTINIGQRPYDMGKLSIITLNKLTKGEKVPLVINTKLTYCTKANVGTCTN